MSDSEDLKISAAVQEKSKICLSVVFTMKAKDNREVQVFSKAVIPVAHNAADDNMCRRVEECSRDYVRALMSVFSYVGTIRTGRQIADMEACRDEHPFTTMEQKMIYNLSKASKGGQCRDVLINALGEHYVANSKLGFVTRVKVPNRLI